MTMIWIDAERKALTAADETRDLNKKILRVATDPGGLLEIVDQYADKLHILNISTLLHRIAKRVAFEGPNWRERAEILSKTKQWQRLLLLLRQQASTCNNMEITNCLWALATLEMNYEESTLLILCELALKHLASFEPRNLALSAWALAKVGCLQPRWMPFWARQVERTLSDFTPQDMTMVIWSFATVHYEDLGFLERFSQEVLVKVKEYGPQDLGNTLWAMATLGYKNDRVLEAISAVCMERAPEFDQQNLSISCWAFATLGFKPMNLLHVLTQHATEKLPIFVSQGMANIVWACAKFGFQQKALLMAVAEEAAPRLDEFEPQHISMLGWAYATLEFPNRPLLTALCQVATRKMHIFSPQHMANLTWAMATLAHKDEEYLRCLVQRALTQVADFNPQECSNLVWAYALLAYRDDDLLAALSIRSQEIVTEFIPQNLGNTAWSYNRLGYRDDGLICCLARQASRVLHECAGQEILDLVEGITTGNYIDSIEPGVWNTLCDFADKKYNHTVAFFEENAGLSLRFPAMSDFDKALAVQDYREHIKRFDLIGLGQGYTSRMLSHFGVVILEPPEVDEWKLQAQHAALGAVNESDASKNVEAQEGLKACRTVCAYRYTLRGRDSNACVEQGPTAVKSGPPIDAYDLGLIAAILKHNRGGDGEFQALQTTARACTELGFAPLGPAPGGAGVEGELWLYVSEVPCLSCCGAMAQFRKLFPYVKIRISFELGRKPVTVNMGDSATSIKSAGDASKDKSAPSHIVRRDQTATSQNTNQTESLNRMYKASQAANSSREASSGAAHRSNDLSISARDDGYSYGNKESKTLNVAADPRHKPFHQVSLNTKSAVDEGLSRPGCSESAESTEARNLYGITESGMRNIAIHPETAGAFQKHSDPACHDVSLQSDSLSRAGSAAHSANEFRQPTRDSSAPNGDKEKGTGNAAVDPWLQAGMDPWMQSTGNDPWIQSTTSGRSVQGSQRNGSQIRSRSIQASQDNSSRNGSPSNGRGMVGKEECNARHEIDPWEVADPWTKSVGSSHSQMAQGVKHLKLVGKAVPPSDPWQKWSGEHSLSPGQDEQSETSLERGMRSPSPEHRVWRPQPQQQQQQPSRPAFDFEEDKEDKDVSSSFRPIMVQNGGRQQQSFY